MGLRAEFKLCLEAGVTDSFQFIKKACLHVINSCAIRQRISEHKRTKLKSWEPSSGAYSGAKSEPGDDVSVFSSDTESSIVSNDTALAGTKIAGFFPDQTTIPFAHGEILSKLSAAACREHLVFKSVTSPFISADSVSDEFAGLSIDNNADSRVFFLNACQIMRYLIDIDFSVCAAGSHPNELEWQKNIVMPLLKFAFMLLPKSSAGETFDVLSGQGTTVFSRIFGRKGDTDVIAALTTETLRTLSLSFELKLKFGDPQIAQFLSTQQGFASGLNKNRWDDEDAGVFDHKPFGVLLTPYGMMRLQFHGAFKFCWDEKPLWGESCDLGLWELMSNITTAVTQADATIVSPEATIATTVSQEATIAAPATPSYTGAIQHSPIKTRQQRRKLLTDVRESDDSGDDASGTGDGNGGGGDENSDGHDGGGCGGISRDDGGDDGGGGGGEKRGGKNGGGGRGAPDAVQGVTQFTVYRDTWVNPIMLSQYALDQQPHLLLSVGDEENVRPSLVNTIRSFATSDGEETAAKLCPYPSLEQNIASLY